MPERSLLTGQQPIASAASSTQIDVREFAHPKYRPDIDGLRAVAVLSVVIFHAFPHLLRGGFIGVDVFFVISGFLISTIIFQNLDKGTFSFFEFYARRVKRIFPALLIVLASCYAFGWYSLFADEFKQLSKHIVAGAAFLSNIALWREAGYFDNSAEAKPLLHLWSLGIEEQFYIVWPLLVWAAWKGRLNLLAVAAVVAIASFILNIYGLRADAVGTFYSPQTRFWELLSGSMLAWVFLYRPPHIAAMPANLCSILGAGLLAFGFWHLSKDSRFPGWWALVPVSGAVLIIAAGPQAWFNRTVLSAKIAVWVGLISFPLYLWHWPLLSFSRIVTSEVPSVGVRLGAVALAIAIAWLTYKVVEGRARASGNTLPKVVALVTAVGAIGYVGYTTYLAGGMPNRAVIADNISVKTGEDGGTPSIVQCSNAKSLDDKVIMCFQDARGNIKYALLGDSKAGALVQGTFRTATKAGRWIYVGASVGGRGPLPIITDNPIYAQYQAAARQAIPWLAQNEDIKVVVIGAATRTLFNLNLPQGADRDISDLPTNGNFDVAFEGMKRSIEILKAGGKKMIIVIDNPTLPYPEDCLYRKTEIPFVNSLLVKENPKCMLPLADHLKLVKKYRDLLAKVKATFPDDVELFDTTPYVCDEKAGVCTHRKNGRFLYFNGDHVSDYASGLIGKDLNKVLNKRD